MLLFPANQRVIKLPLPLSKTGVSYPKFQKKRVLPALPLIGLPNNKECS
jgi:hypothetical protein